MEFKKPKGTILYQSLSLIAATVPNAANVCASSTTAIDKVRINTSYAHWSESAGRYNIDAYQANVELPLIKDKLDLTLEAERDAMSGASSVFFLPEPFATGKGSWSNLVEQRSGASINDTRNQASANVRYFFDDAHIGLGIGHSTEDDYKSTFISPSAQFNFNKNNTLLSLTYSFSKDHIQPTEEVHLGHLPVRPQYIPNSPFNQSRKKTSQKFNIGVRQDLTSTSYGVLNLEYAYDQGYLSDPYKRTLIHGDARLQRPGSSYLVYGNAYPFTVDYDRRPMRKHSGSIVTRFVQYIKDIKSSVHLDYRYSLNSWGIKSNTFKVSYNQPFGEGWEIVPSLRFYTQGAAKFYAMAFNVQPGSPYYSKPLPKAANSSDYRLSSFGNLGGEMNLAKTFWKDNKISLFIGYRINKDKWGFKKRGNQKNIANEFKTFYSGINLTISDPGALSADSFSLKGNKEVETSFYRQGTISFKPLTFNFATLCNSYRKNSSRLAAKGLPQAEYDTYRAPNGRFGAGLNHSTRSALNYSIELGYMLVDNVEIFVQPSFSREKGIKKVIYAPTLNPAIDRAFDFNDRTNYAFLVGGRKYFSIGHQWLPHISASIGSEIQAPTKVKAFNYSFVPKESFTKIGNYQLQGRKKYIIAGLEGGTDCLLSNHISITLTVGVYYKKKPKPETVTNVGGSMITFQDNHRKFSFPISMSLKCIF